MTQILVLLIGSLMISWFKHEDAQEAYKYQRRKGQSRSYASMGGAMAHERANPAPPSTPYSAHPTEQKSWEDKPFRFNDRDNYIGLRSLVPPNPPIVYVYHRIRLHGRIHAMLPWEEIPSPGTCPCGELPQIVQHVLLDCPIHEAAICKHRNARGRA